MAKQNTVTEDAADEPKIEIVQLSITLNGQVIDRTSGEAVNVPLNESASLAFHDEAQLDQELRRKPYLQEIIPILVKAMLSNFDPKKENVKKLKDALAGL